ncbi:hypothetical protein R5R35_014235 [Gryllus longicercus]|uniref:Hyaluronan-mediated motility receptor C-terminal domain-containing protein n=1 Tax=Gryllus longicercus TaxID=2509291 RepID=A0AAN9YT40_9ORTH
MSFSRARIQRFNDAPSCSPAPGTYGPKLDTKVKGPTKTKATRRLSEGDLGSVIPVPTVAAFRTPQVHRKPVKIVGKPQGKENISSMDYLLKVKDTGHDLSELESIKQKLKETVDELNKSENLRELLKADISMKMHQIEELQHKNETLAVENEALQNKFSQRQNSVTRMVELNRELTNRFTSIQEKLSEKEKLCEKYQNQIQTLRAAMTNLYLQMQRTDNTPPDAFEKLKKENDALETQNLNYELEIAEWKRKYHEMESLIGPFKEQLETYRDECKILEAEKGEVQQSMRELSLQYAASLGHQNKKQKIHYMVKLKEQNIELKETVHNLKKTIEKLRKDGTNVGSKSSVTSAPIVNKGKENIGHGLSSVHKKVPIRSPEEGQKPTRKLIPFQSPNQPAFTLSPIQNRANSPNPKRFDERSTHTNVI